MDYENVGRSLAAFEKALHSLPNTLQGTYDRILTGNSEDDRMLSGRHNGSMGLFLRPLNITVSGC